MNTKIKSIAQTSIFIALFVAFGKMATLDFGSMKISIKSLPVYVGAIAVGPVAGVLIGFIGELVLQLVGLYGFTATTLFWTLPYAIIGAICGMTFEMQVVKINNVIKFWMLIICLQILLTISNTIVYWIDSVIYGYYSFQLIFGSLIIKLMSSILVGIVYCVCIPSIIDAIKKIH